MWYLDLMPDPLPTRARRFHVPTILLRGEGIRTTVLLARNFMEFHEKRDDSNPSEVYRDAAFLFPLHHVLRDRWDLMEFQFGSQRMAISLTSWGGAGLAIVDPHAEWWRATWSSTLHVPWTFTSTWHYFQERLCLTSIFLFHQDVFWISAKHPPLQNQGVPSSA